ncbi:glycerol-3-phosphate responsive antiterminator [Cohnella herbarum]|uniref:Glycerol uptake operon antiterminator regulatory protein n=1 Tax=Cohnella herbarum TaxID=2728023 RepID=A0A7Z2VPR1_9BACL|nr:glycerol-3-phosphate responsive antiterminator [Cohnella herbarum]QJD86911.1 glycerol-3-phosphate responsive antiterminator [Cohnella herbarum]
MRMENQTVWPAVKTAKEMEAALTTPFQYVVLLGGHLGQLRNLVELAERSGKKVLLHADLIDGLKNDEYAAEYLCQNVRPAGLISTRASVVQKTRQNKLIAIQRLFLIDTGALEKSYSLMEKTKPDYIEVLPGVIPHMIKEVMDRTGIPVIAGGLIRSQEDVRIALEAGATAITTTRRELWKT